MNGLKSANKVLFLVFLFLVAVCITMFFVVYKYVRSDGFNTSTIEVTLDYDNKLNNEYVYVQYGKKIDEPDTPEVNGYTFVGWYASSDYSTVFSFTSSIKQSTTIYAKFNVVTYHINYNLDVLDTTSELKTSYDVESSTFLLPTSVIRPGYVFVGWYDSEFGGKQVTYILKGTTGDINVYPHFELTFDESVYTKYTIRHETKVAGEDRYITYATETVTAKLGTLVYAYPIQIANQYYANQTSVSALLTYGLELNLTYDLVKFSVSFYVGSTLLGIDIVEYGGSATPPVEYYWEDHYLYWDCPFNYVTSNLEVHAIYPIN